MQKQFINQLNSSFALWFDHTLLMQGEAYTNRSSLLYPTPDDRFRNYAIYASPYKQFVYDSSITGAQIPSGVYVDNVFYNRGDNGLKIDFQNGRAIFTSGIINNVVSGNYATKEYNVYTTTRSDQELIFEETASFNYQFSPVLSGTPANKVVAPAVFLRLDAMGNEAFSFGGQYNSKIKARAVILSDNDFSLSALGNIFTDQKEKNFMLFNPTPLTEFLDIKDNYYNYFDYVNENFDYGKMIYIEDVDFSRLTAKVSNTDNPDLKIGFLDFTFSLPRVI